MLYVILLMLFLCISKAKRQHQSSFIWVRNAKDNVYWDAFRDTGNCEACGNVFLKLLFSSCSKDWTRPFHSFSYIHSLFLKTIHVAEQRYQDGHFLVLLLSKKDFKISTLHFNGLIQILIFFSQPLMGQVLDTCLRLFTAYTWSGKGCMGIKK